MSKISSLVAVILVLVLTPLICYANQDLTQEEFVKIPNPTAADLKRLVSPTVENFLMLSKSEEQKYLFSNYRNDFAERYVRDLTSFADNEDRAVAEKFFTHDVANVNNNKQKFSDYSKALGITITMNGGVRGYSNGVLSANNGQISIRDFKDKYSFEVDSNGNLNLIDKGGNSHTFNGEARTGADRNIEISSGKIDDKPIEQGTGISISSDGTISGSAHSFDGVRFSSSSPFNYNKNTNVLLLDGANILSTSADTDLFLKGHVSIDNYNSILGNLNVLHGTDLKLNEFNIKAESSDVDLRFGSRSFFSWGQETGNFVRFSDKVEINGQGFVFKFNPKNFVDGTPSNQFMKSLIFSNSKNHISYQLGDEGEDVKLIQRLVGVPESGIYDDRTKNAVEIWQGENGFTGAGIDGAFGQNSLQRALGSDETKIMEVTPNHGRVVISKDNGRLNLDIGGENTVKAGSTVFTTKPNGPDDVSLYKEIRSRVINGFEVPVDLTLRDGMGKEVSKLFDVEGPGALSTLYGFATDGIKNQGYFTAKYKTSIHLNTILFDNIPTEGSLTSDRGIVSDTTIPREQLQRMETYVRTTNPSTDPNERFNQIVKEAGEVTNYNPEQALRLISVFGSRYKDLSPNVQEGFGNRHTINGADSSRYKNLIPPQSTRVATSLGVPSDPTADKKYRLITVSGQYLYEPSSLISLEHTSYEIQAIAARLVKSIRGGSAAYGSGDFGDIKADFAGQTFGKNLRNNPREALQNFDVDDYIK